MKKLEFNEFENRKDAVEMLEKVQSEFGGCGQCEEGTDEIWAVSNCNGFETIAVEYDDDKETFFLNTTDIFYGHGEEILAFIKEIRNKII
jgi:hypothetical protein